MTAVSLRLIAKVTDRCLINTLEDALLEQVFSDLPFEKKMKVLPRVCKRWARILRQPSAAWQHIEIDSSLLCSNSMHIRGGFSPIALQATSAWFGRRPNCVQWLHLDPCETFHTMPVAVTTMIIGSQCGSLTRLFVSARDVGLAGQDIAALAALTRLTCLEVYMLSELLEDRGATLLSTVQQLPELQRLDVHYEGEEADGIAIDDSNGLPRCKELASLHSRSLPWLRVAMLDGPAEGNTLRLGGLPELRTCVLLGHVRRSDLHIRIDAASFQGGPKLQELHMEYDDHLQLADGTFEHLTALTKLKLADCRQKCVPVGLTALSATLCVLDLSRNDPLQLDVETVTNIVQCSRLTYVTLNKEEVSAWTDSIDVERDPHQEGYAPSPWDLRSVSCLMQLPSAFNQQHGRDLDVQLQDPWSALESVRRPARIAAPSDDDDIDLEF